MAVVVTKNMIGLLKKSDIGLKLMAKPTTGLESKLVVGINRYQEFVKGTV